VPDRREDVMNLGEKRGSAAVAAESAGPRRIGWAAFAVAIVLCVAQSFATLLACNYFLVYPSTTLIPILTFAVLFLLVFAVNPLLRLIHPRLPFNGAELMAVFASMFVTAGISTFGLTEQLVPIMAAPFNPDWNIPQRGWDRDVNRHLNPRLYFGGEQVNAGLRLEAVAKPFEPSPSVEQAVERALARGKTADSDIAEELSGPMPLDEAGVRAAVADARRVIEAEVEWLERQAERCVERAGQAETARAEAQRRAVETWRQAVGGNEGIFEADRWQKAVQNWRRSMDAMRWPGWEGEVARLAAISSMAPVLAKAEAVARAIAESNLKAETANKLRAAARDRSAKASEMAKLAGALDEGAERAAAAALRRKLEAMAAELRLRIGACESLALKRRAAERAGGGRGGGGQDDAGSADSEEAVNLDESASACRASAERCATLAAKLPADEPDGNKLRVVAEAAEACRRIGADKVLAFRQGIERDQSLWKDVPWGDWVRPICYWLIFVAGIYGIFYFLSSILYDYWAHREKLIFPLAKFPLELLPTSGQKEGAVPAVVKAPLFWGGFLLAFLPLTWNVAVQAGHVKGLGPIPLGGDLTTYDPLFEGTALQGLQGSFKTLIIFTAIGIAFLLPLQISFSAWFYFLVGEAFILFACWLGYGTNYLSFPTDWLLDNNMVTAQAAGGMLCFAAFCLWKAVADLHDKARGLSSDGERLRVYGPALGLLGSFILVSGWLVWNRIGAVWAVTFTAICTLVTIGLMRIVAEGGIFWFQVHVGPFHLARVAGALPNLKASGWAANLTGMWKVPAPVLAALMPIYSVLFLDIKTFLAPSLLSSFKIQEETRAQRRRFHALILAAILISVFASLAIYIGMSYQKGGAQMNYWFASMCPQSVMEKATAVVREDKPTWSNTAWYGAGIGWVLFSTWIRNRAFWFPHPIGYIMLANPLMQNLWFSLFLGWIAKKIVVTYGGKDTFERVKALFIGMILGEIFACGLWMTLALIFNWPGVNIDLNRYRA
jgi:hypothetical protein